MADYPGAMWILPVAILLGLAAEPTTMATRKVVSRERYDRHRAKAAKYAPRPQIAKKPRKPKKVKPVEIRWGTPDGKKPAATTR